MTEGKTAARRYAEAYYKETGLPVRIFEERARRKTFVEEPYVHWLEDRLAGFDAVMECEKPEKRKE